MPKPKRKEYGPNQFGSLSAAYAAYSSDRLADTGDPNVALAPREKFGTIWDWSLPTRTTGLAKRVARPV